MLNHRASFLVLFVGFLPLLCGPALAQGLSLEEKEEFLRLAKIVSMKTLSEGITQSSRAQITLGKVAHEAQIQTIDEFKQIYTTALGTELNFRDTYKANIAAYRLAKLLGLGHMVPPSVPRKVRGVSAAVTWWVDNTLMTEKERFFSKKNPPNPNDWNQQMLIVRVFDQLIYNTDRNLGNLVIDTDWNLHMIDHTRAFRTHRKLRATQNLTRCDRQLLESLKKLDAAALNRDLRPFLDPAQIRSLLTRRDVIVQLFESKAERSGETAVFYDYLATR